MIHFNGNALFNIPVVYDDAARERMETHVPLRSFLLMHDALKTRDFELLQQDATFRAILSQQCLCCGKSVTLTGPAKEHVLHHHLQTMHPEPHQAIQCLIQMVIHRKGHDHLTTCDWCGVTIVPTHANNEYDDHLAECPVLLHFVTWLLVPLTSPSHGNRAGEHGISDQGCAGNAGGLRGSKRPLSEEAKKESAVGTTQSRTFKDAISDVSVGAAARERSELPAPAEHLHPLHVDGEERPDVTDSAEQFKLEATATATPSNPISSTMPGAQCDADSGSKSRQSDGMQEGGPLVALKPSKQDSATGFIMALSQMGSSEEILGGGCEGEQHTYEGPHADLMERPESIVRFHSLQNQTGTSDPMEIGTGHEGSQVAQSIDFTGELQRVATHTDQTEPSSSTAVQISRRPYEAPQDPVARSLYCNILSELILVNDNVQCYVNATFLTIMWTHLMCGDFSMGSWGETTAIFLEIVKDGETMPLCLRSHLRLQSDAYSPILLHSDLWENLAPPKQFQQVLDQWHHSNGMLQAVEQASHILCFQICRFRDARALGRAALDFGNLRAFLPYFIDARLNIARIPYQIAALVHYNGNARGGHYNCVVAYLDKHGDLRWLFHDDNCKPVAWTILPEWFLFDVTHVWMIRSDKYHQWKQPPTEVPTQELALASVLAQLRDL